MSTIFTSYDNSDKIYAAMGSKGHISGKDVQRLLSEGISQERLSQAANYGGARFGPNALAALGINSVVGYDPSQYNPAVAFAHTGMSAPTRVNAPRFGSGYYTVPGKKIYTRVGPVSLPAPQQTNNAAPSESPGGPRNTDNYPPIDMGGYGAFPSMTINTPEPEPMKFAPGGAGSALDSGATGFRRKRSSARLAGLTSKGTSQFKITGQSAKSSGLNIGN